MVVYTITVYQLYSLTYLVYLIRFSFCDKKLSTEFEIWCMTITMEDRTTYEELKAVVLDFLKNGLVCNDEENSMLQQLSLIHI